MNRTVLPARNSGERKLPSEQGTGGNAGRMPNFTGEEKAERIESGLGEWVSVY